MKTSRRVRKIIKYTVAFVCCIAITLSVHMMLVSGASTADRGFNVPVTWNDGDEKVTLPTAPEGWKVSLFGSDRKEVVALDGSVTRPLEDVTVNLLYKLENIETKEVIETNENTQIRITKKLASGFVAGSNAKPKVLPALREWAGGNGSITIEDGTRILVDSANYREADAQHVKANLTKKDNFYAQVHSFQADLLDLMGIDAPIVVDGTPQAGDIYFTAQNAPTTLGKEGYCIEIGGTAANGEYVIVKAPQKVGVLYGGVSILQILKENQGSLPKGIIRDYPEFETRGYMMDVARTFIPMDDLDNVMKQMSWYKMNYFAVHLSDNDIWGSLTAGKEIYSAFRLESKVPNLTAKDGYYTKDEFRTMQYDGDALGIAVVPELDTPGHALAYTRAWPDISRNDSGNNKGKYLDVSNPNTAERIKTLFDEYIVPENGKEEVFVLPAVNIGTDEYKNGNKEHFRQYTDTLLKHIKNSGKEPVFWGSLTENGGTTPVMTDATMFAWYRGYANPKDSLEAGYNIVSMEDGEVYIIPGGGYYNNQYGRGEHLYNNWLANNNSGWSNSPAPLGHPRVSGGQFANWNDWVGNGISAEDINFRIQYTMRSIAQKTWGGDELPGTYAEFKALGESLGDAPNGGFLYTDETYNENEVVNIKNTAGIESNAGASLQPNNIISDIGKHEGGIRFQGGESYIKTDLESTGFDWTTAMWIKPDADNTEDSILMEGKTGTLKLKQGKSNKLGYSVDKLFDKDGNPTIDKYNHNFNYEVPSERWTHIALSGDAYGVKLYVNGVFVDELKDKPFPNYNPDSGQNSVSGQPHYYETLMLPTSVIGSKTNAFKGVIDDLAIYNRVLSDSEIADLSEIPGLTQENLALAGTVTASGNEVNNKWSYTSVNDGNRTGDSRWSSNYADNAWLTVDLGSVKKVSQVDIYWEAAYAIKYKILTSVDGSTWDEVLNVPENGDGGFPKRIIFPQKDVQYVKFQGVERKVIGGSKWGYSMYEIEVFKDTAGKPELIRKLNAATALYSQALSYLDETTRSEFEALLNEIEEKISEEMTNEEITSYMNQLTEKSAAVQTLKTEKDKMIIARDALKTYAEDPDVIARLQQTTLTAIDNLLKEAKANLDEKKDVENTIELTTRLQNMLEVSKDEVNNADIVKGATVTSTAEVWPGFPFSNLVDGNMATRVAFKRTGNPITMDITLPEAQKGKVFNRIIIKEKVGTIEEGEVVTAQIASYDVQVKQADGSYKSIQKVEKDEQRNEFVGPYLSIDLAQNVNTDVIRLIVQPKSENSGLNISEVEVYNDKPSEQADTSIRGIASHLEIPAISERDKLNLPSVPEGYQVQVIRSSNSDVISHNGTLQLPTEEKDVSVVMQVSKEQNNNVIERATHTYVINVPKGASESEIDSLSNALDEAKKKKESQYSIHSWNVLSTAVENAQTQLNKVNMFYDSFHTALQKLQVANAGLVDLSELQKRIEEFEQLDPNDYYTASYEEYQTLLNEKAELLTKADVSAAEILTACNELDAFTILIKGDVTKLQTLIGTYEKENLIEDNFTKTTWNAYQKALQAAQKLLDKGECTKNEVNQAYEELSNTHGQLISLVRAKQELADAIDKDISNYTPKTKAAYEVAIQNLQANVSNEDVSKLDLENAITKLKQANANLVEKANREELQVAYENALSLIEKEDQYTKDSYASFYQAYQNVKQLLNDENANKADGEKALKALEKTQANLKKTINLQEGGVVIETDENAIPSGTMLVVKEISEKEKEQIHSTLADIGHKMVSFDISLLLDGKNVTPQQAITVKLPIQKGFDHKKLALYYVNGNHREAIAFTIEGEYIVFKCDHFSNYTIVERDDAVVDKPIIDPTKPETPSENEGTHESVKTGDMTKTGVLLCSFAFAGYMVLSFQNKRKKSKQE